MSLEAVAHAVSGKIPSIIVRFLIFPGMVVLGFLVWRDGERITNLETGRAVIEAQRQSEIRAIDALTAEVVGMRADQQLQARKQIELLKEIMERRR